MTRRRIGEGVFIFVMSFLLYAATSPGDVIGDTEIRWDVARSIVDHGGFDIASGSTPNGAPGCDGRYYSFYGPGQSLLMVPAVALGRVLAALRLPLATSGELVGQFIASVVLFPLFGAGAVVMLYCIVSDTTGDRRAARWLAVVLAITTMHWQYSVNTYEESQIAFFLLAAVWAIQRFWRTDRSGYLLLALAMMGLGVLFRLSSVVLLVAVAAVGLAVELAVHRQGWGRRLGRWLLLGGLGVGPLLIALGAYNSVRFGSPFETGYGPAHAAMGKGIPLFGTPILEGLGGLLFSPGKSVFLYNPVLLLAIVGFAAFWKAHRGLALMVIAAFGGTVLFHSNYTFWSGDLAWGPRYLASVMGLCVLPMVVLIQRGHRRWLVVPIVLVSLAVQLSSVVYSFGLEYYQDRRHGTIPDAYVWRAEESQLFCRLRNIALHLMGRPDFSSIPPEHVRPETHQVLTTPEQVKAVHGVAIFPFKARAATGNVPLYRALLALWVAMLLAAVGWGFLWWRRIRSFQAGPGLGPFSAVANPRQSPRRSP